MAGILRIVLDSEIRLPPGELQRLNECALEPIRVPGSVQPHGVLLAAHLDTLTISHLSDNVGALLGAEPMALFGQPLSTVFGIRAVEDFLDVVDTLTVSSNPVRVPVDDVMFDAVVHVAGELLVVEIEPLSPELEGRTATLRAALRRLMTASTIQELWDHTATEISRITGFDRVMVYHFHPDDHGEVVAEVAAEGMEQYFGLHYPASDIPAQARELYLTKLSRLIGSSTREPAALLADANAVTPETLDLSGAELRAVSPHHREFMRNMGQASTFSLSIVSAGRLVGMITCAHRTERRIPYATREMLEIFANQMALHLAGMREIDRLERRNRIRDIRGSLAAQLALTLDIPRALMRGPITLLDLVPAAGAVVYVNEEFHRIGEAPNDAELVEFTTVLAANHGLKFSSNAMRLDHPEIATTVPDFAGALVRPFGHGGGFIAWFRHEIVQTVEWLGDMSPTNRLTVLSPRNSFSSWTEDVTGTSARWGGVEREVGELCLDLDSVLLRRVESELAELALRDALTGLPNRRLLMDRLGQGIARAERQAQLAVLFIDLDGFKKINDTHGHAAGDDALRFVARRLEETARREDTVARLGGDEFVVLCENTSAEEAAGIAQRILSSLANAEDPAPAWSIGASIGIAMATLDVGASQLLSAADAAMYRAKAAGANRIEF